MILGDLSGAPDCRPHLDGVRTTCSAWTCATFLPFPLQVSLNCSLDSNFQGFFLLNNTEHQHK